MAWLFGKSRHVPRRTCTCCIAPVVTASPHGTGSTKALKRATCVCCKSKLVQSAPFPLPWSQHRRCLSALCATIFIVLNCCHRAGLQRALVAPQAWREATVAKASSDLGLRRGQADFGDIPIFDAGSVPGHVLEAASRWREQPFVLRGDPRVLGLQDELAKQSLVEVAQISQINVSCGYSWTIAANGGCGHRSVPLPEYLESVMYQQWYDGGDRLEPAYAFDRNGRELEAVGLKLPDESFLPEFIRAWNVSTFGERLFMLGGPESAVGWHRHGPAVQMMVHGCKRWFLYPSGRYPPGDGPGGGFSLTDWLRVIYPTLPRHDRPLEFIQKPGDVVYIPDGWYHAVINLADSLAVSLQSSDCKAELQEGFKRVSMRYVEYLRENDPEALDDLAEAAKHHMQRHPENDLHARKVLFYVLSRDDPLQAVDLMLDGVQKDPFHVPSQFELANWLVENANAGEQFALPAFKRAMLLWRPYLEKNTRNLKALWILDKYEKLLGDPDRASLYHDRLVGLHTRGIDR